MTTLARPVTVLSPKGDSFSFEYRHPDNIVKCRDKAELERLLAWYSYPFIKHTVPDSPIARRRYVEQVRPALRWFCKKYSVKIPEWLEGNGHYDEMSGDEAKDFFGDGDLRVHEFDEQAPIEQ